MIQSAAETLLTQIKVNGCKSTFCALVMRCKLQLKPRPFSIRYFSFFTSTSNKAVRNALNLVDFLR